MAPLSAAVKTTFSRRLEQSQQEFTIYDGVVDKEWCIISVPHGGYVIALALDAVTQFQADTRHPDPIHLTAHFLRTATVGPFEVHIRVVKAGKGAFTNLSVEFVQKGQPRVMLHIICGNLKIPRDYKFTRPDMTVAPPSPYATQIPMQTHPSKCELIPDEPKWMYLAEERLRVARDPIYEEGMWKPGPMELSHYVTLTNKDEQIKQTMIPIFADIFLTFSAKNPKLPSWTFWCPTIVFTLEFKFPLPDSGSVHHSPRTVTAYHEGRFLNEPHGRHETYMEVWTAPANIGDGPETVKKDWREHQCCLAIAQQMNMMVDVDEMPGGGRDKLKTTSWWPKL